MTKSSPFRGVTLFRPTGKWRAQISALGRTVSLGDHDTEEEAAHAFDRAAISKGGRAAKTNFPVADYEAEIAELTGLSQDELVAMLRSRARKNGSHTSAYRGVSLLKQTGEWRAQISIGRKQVHLGYFASEQLAAKAYDRAVICKGEPEGHLVATNFDTLTYNEEMEVLKAMHPDAFVTALADDERRTGLLDMLARGFSVQGARGVFGSSFMRPAGSRASGAQSRAPKAHRELQALQKDAPGNLSASTSRTGTRKRKLVEPVTAAATANLIATAGDANCTDAAEQASTVSLQQERSLGISDTTPTEGVTAAAQAAGDSQVCANPKRRTSRRNAVKSEQVQTPAGTAAAAAAAIGANGTVGESNKSTDNVDRTQAQAQSHTDNEQTGQQHTALPQAAAASAGRTRARAGSVTHGDASPVPTQEAVKSEEAIPVLDRQSDAEQSIAGNNRGERAESDRDKRLSARQQRVAAKPKSRLGTGTDAAAHAAGLGDQRPDPQTSAEANALPAEERGPKPASRSAKRSMTPLSNLEAQVSHTQSDVPGSCKEAAADPQAPHQTDSPAELSAAEQTKATPTANGLDAAALTTGATGKTRRAKQNTALARSSSVSGAEGTAGQARNLLEAQPSHAPAFAKAESFALGKPSAAVLAAARPTQSTAPNSAVQPDSVPPAVTSPAESESANLPDQNGAPDHLTVITPLTSPPGPVANWPAQAGGQAEVSLLQSTSAAAGPLSGMDPASAAAAAQHNVKDGSEPTGGEGGRNTGGPQAPAVPKQAPAAAETQPLALENGDRQKVMDMSAGIEEVQTPTVLPDILPTPPVSPSTASAAPTPLTALAATTVGTAQRPTSAASLSTAAGQAPAPPFILGQPALQPAFSAPVPTIVSNALVPASGAAAVTPETDDARQLPAAGLGGGSAAGDVSPCSPDFKLSARSQPPGNRSEATSSGSLAPPPSKSASASSAIAAAARANAAAANAIAECGALANRSFSGAFGQLPGQVPGQPAGARLGEPLSNLVRTFTVPANNPPAQYPPASQPGAAAASYQPLNGAMTNSLARASSNAPMMSGAFSAGRPGQSPAGQASAMSASSAASSSLPMTQQQQQRLNGTAFMTAMQQSVPGVNPALGNFHSTASDPYKGFPPTSLSLGGLSQHNTASSAFASGPGPQPFLNPNFRLPSGPAPFRLSSKSSLGSASGNPSFMPSCSANPGPSGHPIGPGSQYPALGHSPAAPGPALTKPAGSQAPGNPLSPSYSPQRLRTTALDSGDQTISDVASQGSWGQGTPPIQPQPQPQASLPAGAQVSPATSRQQPMPQLSPQTSMAPEMQSIQSRGGMTNAHAIVPGMLPSTMGRGPNTAWQVGLAAGLAATANLRPPNPALGHQAATTAAAARAAAAFQASRALSMAKSQSQQSPLLQQGSVGASVSGPAATGEGPNLAGPSTMPSSGLTSQAPSAAASSMPGIATDSTTDDAKFGNQADPAGPAGAASSMSAGVAPTAGPAGLQAGSLPIASHQAFARQALPAAPATAVATSTSAVPGSHSTAASALPGPVCAALGPIGRTTAGQQMPPSATGYQGPTAYSAEAQALYRARAQQQPAYGAQSRPYLGQTQPGGALPPSYVSLSQPPYNVQTHTPYIAPSQVPYVPPSQAVYKHPAQSAYVPHPQLQSQYPTVAAAQARYATATQRYAAAVPQLAQPRPQPRPPLNVQHLNFAKLAPQPKNAIDIISEDAVLPTFPLKKKKPKKRKLAGFEVFAAEVAKHKQLALEAHSNALQCHFGKRSLEGRPPKDFRPRMPSATQQAEQQLAKASSVTSLAGKPKGQTTKGTKGKQAATAKGTKGKKASKAADDSTPRKKNDRVNWNGAGTAKRRSMERVPSGRQFADVARLHQETVGTSGMEQLLGALQQEFGDLESEQASDSDDGQGSGTEQGGPSRVSASGRGRGVTPVKRAKGPKLAAKLSGPGRGRGKVKGTAETAAGRVVKSRKRAPSSSPDRGPPRSNRRKIQAPSREA